MNSRPFAAAGWVLLAAMGSISLTSIISRKASIALAALLGVTLAILDWSAAAGPLSTGQHVAAAITTTAVLALTPATLAMLAHELKAQSRLLAQQAERIDDLTVRDSQTGVYRPQMIDALLAEEIDRARRYHRSLTLAVVSADDWAVLVRERGEANMQDLATRLVHQLLRGTRTVDKIVQQDDGSFVLVLPETPLEGAEVLAERLQAAVSGDEGVTMRIGLANFPRDAVSEDGLISAARAALVRARTANLLVVDHTPPDREA